MQGGFFFSLSSCPSQKSSSGSQLVSWMRRELSFEAGADGCVMWVFVACVCRCSEQRQRGDIIPVLNIL